MKRFRILAALAFALVALLAAPSPAADEARFGLAGDALTLDYAFDGAGDIAPFVTLSPSLDGGAGFVAAGIEYRLDQGGWRARPALGLALQNRVDIAPDPITNHAAPLPGWRPVETDRAPHTAPLFYLRLDLGRQLSPHWAVYLRAEHLHDSADPDRIGFVFVRRFGALPSDR